MHLQAKSAAEKVAARVRAAGHNPQPQKRLQIENLKFAIGWDDLYRCVFEIQTKSCIIN